MLVSWKKLVFLLVGLGLCSELLAGEKKKILKLATLDWEPYCSASLPFQGYSTELVRRVFEKAGYQIEVSFFPWPRVLSEVEAGRYDLGAPAYPSEDRYKRFWVSDSFAKSQLGFFKLKKTAFEFKDLSRLRTFKVGVVRGYSNGAIIDLMTEVEKEVVSKDEMNFKKLINHRIDLAIGDRLNGLTIIHRLIEAETDPKKIELLKSIEFVDPPLVDNTLHVLISRANPNGAKLLEEFNSALKELKADGGLEKINKDFHF